MHRFLMAAAFAVLTAGAGLAEGRITVTGTGEASAVPDMAVVSVGVTTEARVAAEALSANSAALSTVLARLKAAGIEDRDLQTSNLSLVPMWEPLAGDGGGARIRGYMATNQLDIRVRSLDGLGGILDAAVSDGANTLGGLTFLVSDREALMDAARADAVRDARRKAELMAEAAGVALGPLLELNEAGGMAPPVPMARMEMADAAAPPVEAGEVGLSATVTLVYGIGE